MEIDEAAVMEYIRRRVILVIMGSGGCCNCTAVAQCGACIVSREVTFACRVVLLSANKLPLSFESWCELDLLCQMVRLELVNQCTIQCDTIEERVWGVRWLVDLLHLLKSRRSWIWSVGVRVVLVLFYSLIVPGCNLCLSFLIPGCRCSFPIVHWWVTGVLCVEIIIQVLDP